jgi:hypothetical protein
VLGFFLAPFLILGLMAANYVSLEREASALRRSVMDATGSHWKTKVQISVGGLTLEGLRAGLSFVQHAEAEKARLALGALTRTSIGVYQRNPVESRVGFEKLLVETDREMQQRGWSRAIGVSSSDEDVIAYVPAKMDAGGSIEFCFAVLKKRELVVVSGCLDADGLADVLAQHLPEGIVGKFSRQRETARTDGRE